MIGRKRSCTSQINSAVEAGDSLPMRSALEACMNSASASLPLLARQVQAESTTAPSVLKLMGSVCKLDDVRRQMQSLLLLSTKPRLGVLQRQQTVYHKLLYAMHN